MGNVVMAVSVMWRGIRVNLLYRRPGAASARLMSVAAFEAAALARKGVFVKGLRDCCGEASLGVRIRSVLDLFVSIKAARNSRLRRLEATSVLFSRGATELSASKVPVFFGSTHLFLSLR